MIYPLVRIISTWNRGELDKHLVQAKTSSNIHSLAYDPVAKQLYIRFLGMDKSGVNRATYVYDNVPLTVYRKFFTVPSKGHYFWQAVRGKYPYRKISK